MEQTWRWFGTEDRISLRRIRQAGATGIVSSLYSSPVGAVWSAASIAAHKAPIEAAGLRLSVVESLPVHSAVRLQEAGFEQYIEHYRTSLKHLGEAGVATICYNFMPVIDWTRTSLNWTAKDGSVALRFDATEWAVFDLFLLKRAGVENDYSSAQIEAAERLAHSYTEDQKQQLIRNVAAGLPGANEKGLSLDTLKQELERWQGVDSAKLRKNLIDFLSEVLPEAERYQMRLCLHPDDPPRPLLGLPRVASCGDDFSALFDALPSESNAMTLCVGSLGAGAQNCPEMLAQRFASRIGFAHLRSVALEQDGSFVEAEHLSGNANLVKIIQILLHEEAHRRASGLDQSNIPMRPDHGRTLEGDIADRPGYSWIGRLKALAELRGIIHTLEVLNQPPATESRTSCGAE